MVLTAHLHVSSVYTSTFISINIQSYKQDSHAIQQQLVAVPNLFDPADHLSLAEKVFN
jgi:hypothetical protein